MNSTERVMAAIAFQKPDRVPIWDNPLDGFVENWRRYMRFGQDANPATYYGYDMIRCVADESFFPSRDSASRDDGDYIVQNDGWGRAIRVGKENSYFSETISTLLDNPSDVDSLEFESVCLDSRYTELVESVNKLRSLGRCVFCKVGGIYARSQLIRREDRLLVDMAMDETFCDALFDKVAEHITGMALETLRRTNSWDTGLFIYDDMANSRATMFSPAMFERYFLPRYKRVISAVRAAGCKHVFLHSDGNILPVMDLLLEAGFEGFHPLEDRCGYNLPKLREKYGKRVVFFGGMCNTRILPAGNKKEIEDITRRLIDLGRDGGLILGSASISKDVPPEAYDFYMSVVREYGRL